MKPITQEELSKRIELHQLLFSGDPTGKRLVLHEYNLQYADFSGVCLRGADFSGSNLSHANLRKTNLSYSTLNSAQFHFASLDEANLSHSEMRNVILRKASLKRANLHDASIFWTDFFGADLDGSGLVVLQIESLLLYIRRESITIDNQCYSVAKLKSFLGDEIRKRHNEPSILTWWRKYRTAIFAIADSLEE